MALLLKPSLSVTSVPLGSSRAAVLLASFRRSGFHGLLLPLPSCLTEVSCNSNHCVTSIAVTPSSLSIVSLEQEQPPLFLPAGSLGGGSLSRKGHVKKRMGSQESPGWAVFHLA